jgi:DNA/RNA endonuclease G (NUC1)
MKKLILFILLLQGCVPCPAQKIIPVYDGDNLLYTSYYDKQFKVPLYVTDTLYKVDSKESVSRKGMTFKKYEKIPQAGANDYDASGYDIGHIADAKDFSYSANSERQTFFFINAEPQIPDLNRGCWLRGEDTTRQLSDHDRILVIAGGYFSKTHKWMKSIAVPDACWKIVQRISDGAILYCIWCTNSYPAQYRRCTVSDIRIKTGYNLPIK